ncbi:hypothetical protein [Vaginella massiliensis]|uniref:hypothetical protein n=1 Tax=Vaginella massiliensis TaxID=1816680 RepID=UPI0012B5C5B9|nr:hypothetical protein [Vaginella massiliensis]
MRDLLSILVLICIMGCHREKTPRIHPSPTGVKKEYAHLIAKPKTEPEEITKTAVAKTNKTIKKVAPKKNTTVAASPNNTTDTLEFVYAKTSRKLSKLGKQTNSFVFDTNTANKLEIELVAPDSAANIHIAQLYGPDGIKAGPFGKKIEYALPAKGVYKVLIAENPQQNRAYNGEYEIKMKLKW